MGFTEALAEENRPYGVHVMALCPGVTDTNFFAASHMDRPPMRISETAEDVVDTALRGLKRHKASIVSGWTNRLLVFVERFLPRFAVLRIAGKALRQRFDS